MPDDPLATERAAMWACAQCAKHFLVLTADETAPGVCPCCQSRNLYQTYSYWVTPTMEEVETEDTPRVVTRSLTTPALAVRPVVQWFAAHMEAKLRANDHKGGWSTETWFALAARIFDEWRELGRALSLWSINATDVTTVVAECADVAALRNDGGGRGVLRIHGRVRECRTTGRLDISSCVPRHVRHESMLLDRYAMVLPEFGGQAVYPGGGQDAHRCWVAGTFLAEHRRRLDAEKGALSWPRECACLARVMGPARQKWSPDRMRALRSKGPGSGSKPRQPRSCDPTVSRPPILIRRSWCSDEGHLTHGVAPARALCATSTDAAGTASAAFGALRMGREPTTMPAGPRAGNMWWHLTK